MEFPFVGWARRDTEHNRSVLDVLCYHGPQAHARAVAEVVAKGEVEIGLQQINVIIPVEGSDYIGPLPKDLQDTVRFAGAVLTASKDKNLARAFLNYIASADAGPLLRRSGMEAWH